MCQISMQMAVGQLLANTSVNVLFPYFNPTIVEYRARVYVLVMKNALHHHLYRSLQFNGGVLEIVVMCYVFWTNNQLPW